MIDYVFISKPSFKIVVDIGDLYRAAGWWPDAPDHPDQIKNIVTGSHCFVAAMAGVEVAGMGRALSDRVSDAYIQDVTVRDKWRGRGIAKEIIRTIIEQLRKDGIHWIGLIAERGTHNLYRSLGFTEMAEATPLLLENIQDAF